MDQRVGFTHRIRTLTGAMKNSTNLNVKSPICPKMLDKLLDEGKLSRVARLGQPQGVIDLTHSGGRVDRW